CTVNVQHNCHDSHCPQGEVDNVLEEREKTSKKKNSILHQNLTDFILNTSHMRDGSLL
ncbi:hypothetical protein BDZ89DRAFT_919719, partial [Hymenopellis radicata]